MKDAKTTLTGLLAGGGLAVQTLLEAYEKGVFTGKTGVQLVVSIAIVLLGLYAGDSKKNLNP